MIDVKHNFEWLQNWYKSQCDGDWEHEYGITIETVDNPGWYVTINLTGTCCENYPMPKIKIDRSETDWYFCLLRNNNFEASCGPSNLSEVLDVFRKWVEKYAKTSIEENFYEFL